MISTSFYSYFLFDAIFIGVGIFLFVRGYASARKRWLIRNTPTSTIRSVAMGLAEVSGFAKQKYPLTSQLCNRECVYFKFTIEELRRTSKGGNYWSVIEQGASTLYFYVEDATGTLLVDPLGAETAMPFDYRKVEGGLRYTEWRIEPDFPVYILGTVRKFKDAANDRAARIAEKLRQIKQDPLRMRTADTDGDGQVSAVEWDAVRAAAEQEALAEELKEGLANTKDDIVIGKGNAENTFLLSDRDETEVARGYFWKGGGLAIAGILIIAAMCVSLSARLSILPDYLAIMWNYSH